MERRLCCKIEAIDEKKIVLPGEEWQENLGELILNVFVLDTCSGTSYGKALCSVSLSKRISQLFGAVS